MLNRIRKRNKAIAVALAITAITQGLPIMAVNAAVTATATAQVAGSMGTVVRTFNGTDITFDYMYSYSEQPTGLWGDNNYSATLLSSETKSSKSSSKKTGEEYYILLAVPGQRVNLSRTLDHQYTMGLGVGGTGNGSSQCFSSNSGGGFSISFIMPDKQVQNAFFYSHHWGPSDWTYHENYTLIPLVNIDMGNPSSEQASKAQQALLNYKANNGTTIGDLQAIANNSIDTSKFTVNVSQTGRQDATESSDGMLSGNLVVTENSSGKQTTSSFAMQISKLGQSLNTIATSLNNFIKNYNAINSSNPSDFINAVAITNPSYNVSVENWALKPSTDTQTGNLSCNVYINENGTKRQVFNVNKQIDKLATTTATAKAILTNLVSNYAASNYSDQAAFLNMCKNAVSSNINVTLSNWKLDKATESSTGNLNTTINISDGTTTETINVSKPISFLDQTIDTAQINVQNAINNIAANNYVTDTEILNIAKSAVNTNYYDVSISNFENNNSTETNNGNLKATITIIDKKNSSNTRTVELSKKIPILSQTLDNAKSIVAELLEKFNFTNDTTKDDILNSVNKAINTNYISASIDNFDLKQSTETTTGSAVVTVGLKSGSDSTAVTQNYEIGVQKQSVETVKAAYEKILADMKANNNTSKEEILDDVLITNPNIKVSIADFEITPANESKSGIISASINITDGTTTATVPVKLKIAQLQQSVETVKTLFEKRLPSFVATNGTTEDDLIALVDIYNEDIKVSVEDYSILSATDTEQGAIVGKIKIEDNNNTEYVEVNRPIQLLSQELSTSVRLVQNVLNTYSANNNTTFDEILRDCNNVVKNSNVDVYYKVNTELKKVESTEFDEGYMSGVMVLNDGSKTIELPFNIRIGKTNQTISGAKTLITASLKTFKPTNETTEREVLNAIETNIRNSNISVAFGTDEGQPFEKTLATVYKAGAIKGTIKVSDTSGTNVEVPVDLSIEQLEQSISEAEESINVALPGFNVSNDTEESDIKNQIQNVVSSNIYVTTKDFEKNKATLDEDGNIKVTVILLNKNTTETKEISLDLKIKQLKESLADATAAVDKAEKSKSQSDLDLAQKEVNRLPDGQDKTDLQNRINVIQDIINANTAVTKAEQSKNQSDVNEAQKAIDKLPNGPDKTDLEDRVNKVEQTINQELQDAKAKAQETLSNYTANNSTTEQDLINVIKGNISNPNIVVAFGTGENEAFTKKDADTNNTGNIIGVIIIKNGSNSVTVPVNMPIAKTIPTNTNTSSGGSSGGSSSHSTTTTSNIVNTETASNKNDNGWKNINGVWYYYSSDGNKYTGWKEIEGLWYYFDVNGVLKTGWFQDTDGHWYYLDPTPGQFLGSMQTGWKYINGYWYFLNTESGKPLGSMAEGWINYNGTWYYLNPVSGTMAIGWLNRNNTWYYLTSSGAMAKGWFKDVDGKWYYLNQNGAMVTGWFNDTDGKWYYLNSYGVMLANATTPDGYYVGADGAWV